MTIISTTTDIAPPPPAPVWRMAVASFLPPSRRAKALDSWVAWLPLMLILAAQAFFSVRLNNSPQPDEGLYLFTGQWITAHWFGGPPVWSAPGNFFSGAPQLYPVIGGTLDQVGGLGLARFFSTLCMMGSTVSVFFTARTLFAHRNGLRVGLLAALVFAVSAPVIFLGHYATYDAMSFALMAAAMALAVWSSKLHKSVLWAVPIGLLCALSVLTKYASAVDVPFVLLLTLFGLKDRWGRQRTLARGVLAGLVALVGVAGSFLSWASNDWYGVTHTTTNRSVGAVSSALTLWRDVFTWAGIPIALMLLGGLYLLRKQPVLAALLMVGTLTATAFQIHIGEVVSLHKHITLGLMLGAPLAGLLLSDLSSKLRGKGQMLGAVLAGSLVWLGLLQGLNESNKLFMVWPTTTGLSQTIDYSVKADPWIRMLGDSPEPVELTLWNKTHYWQWSSTYHGAFQYKGLSDLPAYEAALKDNYFQLVFLDGSGDDSTGRILMTKMASLGFKLTTTVKAPNANGHTWQIWQRWDHVPK